MPEMQNDFYSSISKYYSDIFPYNRTQLDFVKSKLGNVSRKQILDIGCATGELAEKLAKWGANVTGIDLNEDLLQQAKETKQHASLNFQQGNMLETANDFQEEEFDAVLCFGNTLVHLQNEEQVFDMLKATRVVLKPTGQFLLQILNYDYIVGEQLTSLPVIDTENIQFIRYYKFKEGSNNISFQTDLKIKAEQKTVSNETPLLALYSKTLMSLLDLAGFKNIQLYSNFKQDAFGGKHIPLVVSCEK